MATDDSAAHTSPPPTQPPRPWPRLAGGLRRAPRRLWRLWRGAIVAAQAAPGYARALPAGRPWFVLRARLLPMDIRDRLARRSLAQRIMDHQDAQAPNATPNTDTSTTTTATNASVASPDATGQLPASAPQTPPPQQRTRYVMIVRHGQTHFNVEGRLPGQLPGVSLTDEGRRQAHQAAVALSALPLSAIIASPLERARDTAEIIARGWALPVRLDPRLMDTDVGAWAGQTIAEVAKNDPNWKAFTEHPTNPPPGVESLATVQARAVAAVEAALDDATTGDYLVIVAHADVVKLIIAQYSGVAIDGVRFMSIANASISALAFPEVVPATDTTPMSTVNANAATSTSATNLNGASPQPADEQSPARPQRLTPSLLAVNWTQTPRWLVGPAPAASVSVAGVPAPTANPVGDTNPSGDTEGYMATQNAPGVSVASVDAGAPPAQPSAATAGDA